MSTLLSDIFLDVRGTYNDCPSEVTDQGLRLANRIHREIVADFKVATIVDYVIFDGVTRDYPLNENYLAVWECDLLLSANSAPLPLTETSVDQLNQESPGWKFPQASQPTSWYLESANGPVLGTDWIEATPTNPANTSGFPILRYTASNYVPLTAGSSIPTTLRSPEVYIAGIVARWGRMRGKDGWEQKEGIYQDEKRELEKYLITKQKYNEPRVRPFFAGGAATR